MWKGWREKEEGVEGGGREGGGGGKGEKEVGKKGIKPSPFQVAHFLLAIKVREHTSVLQCQLNVPNLVTRLGELSPAAAGGTLTAYRRGLRRGERIIHWEGRGDQTCKTKIQKATSQTSEKNHPLKSHVTFARFKDRLCNLETIVFCI